MRFFPSHHRSPGYMLSMPWEHLSSLLWWESNIWETSLFLNWSFFFFFSHVLSLVSPHVSLSDPVLGIWHSVAVREQALQYKSRGICFCHPEPLPGHHLPVQLPATDHGRRPGLKNYFSPTNSDTVCTPDKLSSKLRPSLTRVVPTRQDVLYR